MSATRDTKRWITPQERMATELRSIARVSSPYLAKRLRIAADMLDTAVGVVVRPLADNAAPTPVFFAHFRCRWCDTTFGFAEVEEFQEHVASVHNTEWLASEEGEDLVDQAVALLARNSGLRVVVGPVRPTKTH